MDKKALVGIAEQIKDLDNLEKEIHQLRQEKGGLEHNINLLKKNREEETETFNKEKQKRKAEIAELERITSDLQAKRDALVANTVPEVAQLNSLKQQIAVEKLALDRRQESVSKGFENLCKEQAKFEGKKKILEQLFFHMVT